MAPSPLSRSRGRPRQCVPGGTMLFSDLHPQEQQLCHIENLPIWTGVAGPSEFRRRCGRQRSGRTFEQSRRKSKRTESGQCWAGEAVPPIVRGAALDRYRPLLLAARLSPTQAQWCPVKMHPVRTLPFSTRSHLGMFSSLGGMLTGRGSGLS